MRARTLWKSRLAWQSNPRYDRSAGSRPRLNQVNECFAMTHRALRMRTSPVSFGLTSALVGAIVTAFLLSACGRSPSADVKPDTRTRHNEVHITIHQNARHDDPIIGRAVENGSLSKGTFRAVVRFLKLTVLGSVPSRCAIVIERFVTLDPDEYPGEDNAELLFDLDPNGEKLAGPVQQPYLIPCGERDKSTRIAWPDGSIVLLGHIDDSTSEDSDNDGTSDNGWHFVIDEVTQAPRIAQLDDPGGSLEWVTPTPSPSPWEVVRRTKVDGRSCFSALHGGNYGVAASSCERAAGDFTYAANHVPASGTASEFATLVFVSCVYRKAQSLALHKLGRDSESKDVFDVGKAWLHSIYVTSGCQWCQSAARHSLTKYGAWPPRNDDV